jgi:hypothetical protein
VKLRTDSRTNAARLTELWFENLTELASPKGSDLALDLVVVDAIGVGRLRSL